MEMFFAALKPQFGVKKIKQEKIRNRVGVKLVHLAR